MTQVIRLAGAADLAAVEAVVAAAYAIYAPRIGKKPGPMLDDHAALIGQGMVHVLDNDGTVDGLVVLIPGDEAMILHNVAVRPNAQKLGYGRKLLAFAEDAARHAGYLEIRLYTNQAMHENIARYLRIGFVETHRAQEDGHNRVYMAKSLI